MSSAPKRIDYQRQTRTLHLTWQDNDQGELSAEFLRVHSPSAEVRGHGIGQETLQTGKKDVAIVGLEPVGHYALKISYDDGHDTGLYDWTYLRSLCDNKDSLWASYLQKLEQADATRESLFIPVTQL